MNNLWGNVWFWVVVLVVELAALALLRQRMKKPRIPGQTRWVPLNFIFLMLVMVTFATMAHILSIATGTPIKARSKMGIR